jgi:hypothetical protein
MGQAARRRVCEHFPIGQMGERMVELIERARTLAVQDARPAVSQGVGLEIATQAIEYTRLERLTEQLWAERQALLAHKLAKVQLGRYLALRTARSLKITIRPLYYWGIRHGMTWLVPLRTRVRTSLMRWI